MGEVAAAGLDPAGAGGGDAAMMGQTQGYRVMHFWNNDVLANPEGVFSVIADDLRRHHPTRRCAPTTPIKGEVNEDKGL
jgi:hypothetical protein